MSFNGFARGRVHFFHSSDATEFAGWVVRNSWGICFAGCGAFWVLIIWLFLWH